MIIEGKLERISAGEAIGSDFTRAEFIRVDGKKHRKVLFDNYIGEALSMALSHPRVKLSGVKFSGQTMITAVKLQNGEVFKTNTSIGVFLLLLIYKIVFGLGVMGGAALALILGVMLMSTEPMFMAFFGSLTVSMLYSLKVFMGFSQSKHALGREK